MGVPKDSPQPPVGFEFSIVADSLTEADCDSVTCKLKRVMAGWMDTRAIVRLGPDQTMAITVVGPLTVQQYRRLTEEIDREGNRILKERAKDLQAGAEDGSAPA